MQRIGILGGSFDPVHKGHLQIVQSFLASGLIEKLMVLPAPSPPHKSSVIASFRDRLEMLRNAFQDWERVEVSDFEERLGLPSYTIHTIEALQRENPNTLFYLCLGEDSLKDFHKWYRYDEILEKAAILVAERPGFDSSGINPQIIERAIFVEHHPCDLSSTEVRNSIKDRIDRNSVPDSVLNYINSRGLYGQ